MISFISPVQMETKGGSVLYVAAENENTMFPGSWALKGILSQLSPASEVCSRIAGLPIIHPSLPLKLTELNL
jgi:hypothetical protein